jgi:hypothetical protein
VVQPLIYGKSVKVNPLVTIVSLLVGAELLGILGVLLASSAPRRSRSSSGTGGQPGSPSRRR